MNLIWTVLIGLVVGALAKWLMPGEQGGGIIVTAALGIAGSFVAKFVGQAVGFYGPGANAGFVASLIGAMLVLWLYGRFKARAK